MMCATESFFNLYIYIIFFLVCEQFLKGTVYPLVKKAHNNVQDLAHQKECITLWSAARSGSISHSSAKSAEMDHLLLWSVTVSTSL